jgi:hypothetical protein
MTETQRVPAPRVPLGGRADIAAFVLVSVLTILVTKPWGAPAAPASPTFVPPSAAPTAAPTRFEAGYAYEQGVFGPFQPDPEWSIWPAGFFVTILYVTREATQSQPDDVLPTPRTPEATPLATPATGWPELVTIGPGDHLLWLGINSPCAWHNREASVWRFEPDGTGAAVPVIRLPSGWGPNLAVIGIPTEAGSERLVIWPKGLYRVEVSLDPGPTVRTFLVDIQTLAPGPTTPPVPEARPDT